MLDQISQKIHQTPKYNALAFETITRVVTQIARRFPQDQIEAQSRKKLHQIWSAYYTSHPDFIKLESKVEEQLSQGVAFKEILFPLLKIHSSTRERAPFLDEFYQKIFAVTGSPESIIDHACGLNALTLPWMDLPAQTSYSAQDIDEKEIMFINSIFKKLNFNSFATATTQDLFTAKQQNAKVHFLFKILPLLEQQQRGSSLSILERLNGKYLVISYPTASLSGSSKGMLQTYSAQCEQLIKDHKWDSVKISFPAELVYIVDKSPGLPAS